MMPEGKQPPVVQPSVEQGPTKMNPLERAGNLMKHTFETFPKGKPLLQKAFLATGVMLAACGSVGPDAKDLTRPQPIEQSVSRGEVAGAAAKAEVSESLSPAERASLKQEVEMVMSTVKKFIKPDFLEASKIDLDDIADNFTKDDAGLVDWRQHRNFLSRPDGGKELSTIIPKTTISVTIDQAKLMDYKSVSFKTDPEITSILPDNDDSSRDFKTPFTLDDLKEMPAKLPKALILPEGRKENLPQYYYWVAPQYLDVTSEKGKLAEDKFIFTPKGSGYRTFDGQEYGASIGAADNGVIEISFSSKTTK